MASRHRGLSCGDRYRRRVRGERLFRRDAESPSRTGVTRELRALPTLRAIALCVGTDKFQTPQIDTSHMLPSIRSSSIHVIALFAAIEIAAIAVAAEKNSAPMPADNPFLTESSLPYHLPPFDKIKDNQFVPATEAGMEAQLKEVDAIAANADKA